MKRRAFLVIGAAIVALGGCSTMEVGGGTSPIAGSAATNGNASHAATAQLARCQEPLGTIALVESQIPALAQLGLTSPVPLIRLIAAQSRCFNVVDRGQALGGMLQE